MLLCPSFMQWLAPRSRVLVPRINTVPTMRTPSPRPLLARVNISLFYMYWRQTPSQPRQPLTAQMQISVLSYWQATSEPERKLPDPPSQQLLLHTGAKCLDLWCANVPTGFSAVAGPNWILEDCISRNGLRTLHSHSEGGFHISSRNGDRGESS